MADVCMYVATPPRAKDPNQTRPPLNRPLRPACLQVHLCQRLGNADDSLQLAHSHRDGGDVAAVCARRALALHSKTMSQGEDVL